MALNKVGELHHMRGDLAAAAEHYSQALQLRRALLTATQQQWHPQVEQQGAASRSGDDSEPATVRSTSSTAAAAAMAAAAAAAAAAEGNEACCSAALDLAASCLKLSGARRGLGDVQEAQVRGRTGWPLWQAWGHAAVAGRGPAQWRGWRKCC